MRHRLLALAVVALTGGCGAAGEAAAGSASELTAVSDAGDLPDPCTLLTKAEV